MSDSTDKKSPPKKLQLTKTVEKGRVQQNFARGRSKSVMVEVKKTRTFSRSDNGVMIKEGRVQTEPGSNIPEEIHNDGLTNNEREARLKALELANSENSKKEITEDEPQTESEETRESINNDCDNSATRKSSKIEVFDKKEEQAILDIKKSPKISIISKAEPKDDTKTTATTTPVIQGEYKKKEKPEIKDHQPVEKKKTRPEKRSKSKLTISNALFGGEEKVRSLASIKRRRQKAKRQNDFDPSSMEKKVLEIVIPEKIGAQELANRMAVRSQDVIRELMKLGIMTGTNEDLDADTAELIVAEFGHKFKRVTEADVEDILLDDEGDEGELENRAPVVTIMGHVDHGKTSLLDALRSTNVTAGEAGGITQHIGAYQIETEGGDKITFLDTPGHAAFTEMRQRGAKVTDIVVLLVAADDGVMPQTIEAISHAKAAEVPIIVAINKIDKPDANPQKVKDELLHHELIPEDLGGDIMVVEISAQEKLNLDKLIEVILLQAEILELKASTKQRSSGTVVEARVDKGRGIVATMLVQKGTLRTGDLVVAGLGYGKIKVMNDDTGKAIDEAGPSLPIEILGLNEVPDAGDNFAVVKQEKQAREIVEYRLKNKRDIRSMKNDVGSTESKSLDRLFKTAQGGNKELNVIIKGDVQGSIEAIIGSLEKINNDEVTIKVVHSAAGGVSESDIRLASTTNALMLGFNVRSEVAARQLAAEDNVAIKYYSVIYNLIDDIKAIVGGMMSPIEREEFIGYAKIQQIFKMSKYGKVAGCMVTEGNIKRGAGVRLIRDNVVIHEGNLKTLKRFKDEVPEVKQGIECGMAFENYEDMKEGDVIEAFEIISEERKLD